VIQLCHVTTVPDSLTFLRGQPAFMRDHGVDTTVVSSPGPLLQTFAAREHVTAFSVRMERRITPAKDLEALARLVLLFLRIEPAIVHAHTPKGGLLGLIAARVAGVPVRIYHMRGLPLMTATGARRALLVATERVSCRLATRVVCVSPSLREVALAEGLVEPERISVLLAGSGNGVDSAGRFDPNKLPDGTRERIRGELGIPADAIVIGFVGRIVRDKGIGELVAAWRTLSATHPRLRLLVVGPYEDQDPVDDADRQLLESDPRVHLVGFTPEPASMYTAMDVLALPTYREGFPNVPLEAAAMRLPVVATAIPGCVDAVEDGITGKLVRARDPDALARALREYVTDEALRTQHGMAGRSRVERLFRRETIWEALVATYDEERRAAGVTS
jgi:glycosyltransferase involved in cell wall biosynthesis